MAHATRVTSPLSAEQPEGHLALINFYRLRSHLWKDESRVIWPIAAQNTPPPARPEGRLLWCHAGLGDDARALSEIAQTLIEAGAVDHFILTFTSEQRHLVGPGLPAHEPEALSAFLNAPHALIALGVDAKAQADHFLGHWRPTLMIWSGSVFMPRMMQKAAELGLRQFWVNADAPLIRYRNRRMTLDHPHLKGFEQIFPISEAAAMRIRHLGGGPGQIASIGALTPHLMPLPYQAQARQKMMRMISRWRVCLVYALPRAEISAFLMRLKEHLRLHSRLLLVFVYEGAQAAHEARSVLEESPIRLRQSPQDLGQNMIEALCLSGREALALWAHIAPVTLMGNSFGAASGINPLRVALSGTAILHGEGRGLDKIAYEKLDAKNAARYLRDLDELVPVLREMLANEMAADYALRAWDALSQSDATRLALSAAITHHPTGKEAQRHSPSEAP